MQSGEYIMFLHLLVFGIQKWERKKLKCQQTW